MSDTPPPAEVREISPQDLLSWVLFSETKDLDDAIAIANVIKNRMARPNRFGESLEDVVYAPYQFTGVGSPEFKKAESGELTEQEQGILTNFKDIATGVLTGVLDDPTGGADHYYNPALADPSWGKIYPETYKTEFHRYLKE